MAGAAKGTGTGSQDRREATGPSRRRRPHTHGELDFTVTPVSVTPPRTWRRAAWFAVAASCAVLTVLVFAAARLTGGPLQRIDAFPGLPTGGLLTAQSPPRHSVPPPAVTTAPADQDGATASVDSAGDDAGNTTEDGDAQAGGGQARSTTTGTASPTGPGPRSQGVPPPTVSVLPATGRPPVTAADMVAATTLFYSQLPGNPDEAWAMLGSRAKAQGYDAFRGQWADAVDVQLRKVVVDPDDSTVLATVKVMTTDGAERVQRYQLVFRGAGSPVIDEITPISAEDEGNEPAK
jgi:hypothetical protein